MVGFIGVNGVTLNTLLLDGGLVHSLGLLRNSGYGIALNKSYLDGQLIHSGLVSSAIGLTALIDISPILDSALSCLDGMRGESLGSGLPGLTGLSSVESTFFLLILWI